MKTAFYMRFVRGHHGRLDRIGGVPTHLPTEMPKCPHSGEEFGFLAQFYCTSDRLDLPGVLCLKLWQDQDVDNGGDPLPRAVKVPLGAAENIDGLGTSAPKVGLFDIDWSKEEDLDDVPIGPDPTDEEFRLMNSKVAGTPYHDYMLEPGERFLLQLREDPADFNFAGRMAMVMVKPDGELRVRLA